MKRLASCGNWLKARIELLAPILGLPLFFGMLGWMDASLTNTQTVLVWGLAITYAVLVLWSPMTLPVKERQAVTWARVKRVAVIVVVAVAGALLLTMALRQSSSESSSGEVFTLLLSISLGIAGVVAEGTLPIDLFPVMRRREIRRVLYVIAAALFLMVLVQFWSGLFDDLAKGIGGVFGETPPASRDAASYFDDYDPLSFFVGQLFSAGIEELFFRVGIMTLVWALTRRWGWGLFVSSVCFGLYHISLSGMSEYFLQAPVIAVVESFGAGLANGVIYRYRGFTTAVLVHALGNWLLLMLFMGI
jgi:membrane protease YdiL (CAAX protease family)